MPAPAPYLTADRRCSDCRMLSVAAAGGEMKACPRCYAVLWHADYSAEVRLKQQEAAAKRAEADRIRSEIRRAREAAERQAKAAAKEGEPRDDRMPPDTTR
jgi:hypothetical protein